VRHFLFNLQRATLSESIAAMEALAAVLKWVLLEFNRETLAAGFKPLSGSEVARSRARVLADPLRLRRELWPDAETY
jgi:hypothetical protein